ncbi:MAG: hypothetical protein N2234_05985, partial [Planctomycetota bacterium]|nr:hypothetical protein [Planctomycetota bacterium]
VDVNTGRFLAPNALYENGGLLSLRVTEEPLFFVTFFDKCEPEWGVKDLSHQSVYHFSGMWVYYYGHLYPDEAFWAPLRKVPNTTPILQDDLKRRVRAPIKRLSRGEAFAEIERKSGLDVRNLVHNSDYVVAVSGERRVVFSDFTSIIAPTIYLLKLP